MLSQKDQNSSPGTEVEMYRKKCIEKREISIEK
jgi:hypothetical protein